MANTVKGRNTIIYMLVDSVYYPVFCAKTAEFTIDQDEIEVTSINSGSSREYVPGMSNATCAVTGITTLDNSNGRVSITYLMQQSVRRQLHTFKMVLTDDDSSSLEVVFTAMIKTTNINRDTVGYSQSSLQLRVSGVVEWTEVVDPPAPEEIYSIYLSVTAGQYEVSDSDLGAATILEVWREGINHTETTGTPSGRQFKYTDLTTSGKITFDSAITFNTGEIVYVLYKK